MKREGKSNRSFSLQYNGKTIKECSFSLNYVTRGHSYIWKSIIKSQEEVCIWCGWNRAVRNVCRGMEYRDAEVVTAVWRRGSCYTCNSTSGHVIHRAVTTITELCVTNGSSNRVENTLVQLVLKMNELVYGRVGAKNSFPEERRII